MKRSACLVLFLYLVLAGCGGGHNTPPSLTLTPVISPAQRLYYLHSHFQHQFKPQFQAHGNINANFPASTALSGVMHISNSPCFPFN